MKTGFSIVGLAAFMLIAAPSLAHHSYSMFDGDSTVTLEGTVADFQWVNPHAWILIDVPDENGAPVRWALELPSPGGLARRGWRPRTLTPGMEITATAHPLKDGQNGGGGLSVTLPDGTVMLTTTANVTSDDPDAQ